MTSYKIERVVYPLFNSSGRMSNLTVRNNFSGNKKTAGFIMKPTGQQINDSVFILLLPVHTCLSLLCEAFLRLLLREKEFMFHNLIFTQSTRLSSRNRASNSCVVCSCATLALTALFARSSRFMRFLPVILSFPSRISCNLPIGTLGCFCA